MTEQKKIVIVTMGIPGSGKSYAVGQMFTADESAMIINPDTIRWELSGDPADQTQNAKVFQIAHRRFREALTNDAFRWVVFDATNVQSFARMELLAIASEYDAVPRLMVFDIDYEKCCERNEARERTVPEHAMVRMREQFKIAMGNIESEGWDEIFVIADADEQGVRVRSR